VDDFIALRRKTFGFELAPLPQSLKLSPADANLPRRAEQRMLEAAV
jgi:hypothetical protein